MLHVSVREVGNPDLLFEAAHYDTQRFIFQNAVQAESTLVLCLGRSGLVDDLVKHSGLRHTTAHNFSSKNPVPVYGRAHVGSFTQFETGFAFSKTRFRTFFLVGFSAPHVKRLYNWGVSQVSKFAQTEESIDLRFIIGTSPTNASIPQALHTLYDNVVRN